MYQTLALGVTQTSCDSQKKMTLRNLYGKFHNHPNWAANNPAPSILKKKATQTSCFVTREIPQNLLIHWASSLIPPKWLACQRNPPELGESTVNLASFTKLIFFCVRLAMLMKLSDQNLKSRIQQWICLFPKIKGVKFEEMYMKPLALAKNQFTGRLSVKNPHIQTRSTIHPLSNHCSPLC